MRFVELVTRVRWAFAWRASLILLFSSVHVPSVLAQLIPPDRLVNWTPGVTVGVPGGIPTNRTNLIDVTLPPYNADNTGLTSASAAIQAAIGAAANNDVVYLPAGTYRLDSTLSINKSGITLRGAGTNTHVVTYGSAGFVFVGSQSDYNWSYPSSNNVITSGLTKGSTNIAIQSTAAFSVGQLVRLQFKNDTNIPVISTSGYEYLRRQFVVVKAKTSSNLTIWPPLYTDYSAVQAIANVAQLQSSFVGIEDIEVNATNSTYTFTIWIEQCYGCWMKNVTTRLAYNYHVFLNDSLNCEVRGCFLDRLNHVGSNGSGLLVNACSGCLVEDNVIYHAFPLVEVNQGSSGNAFSYNLLEDSSSYGAEGAAIDSNHGPHNSFNLYEGNVTPNLQCDGYFGSASHDTLFRNWLHAMEPGTTQAGWTISLNRFTRYYSVVGNVLGNSNFVFSNDGVSCGNPNMGNSAFTGYGPPWSNAVRTASPITASQSGNLITSSAPFFVASDVGKWVTYPDYSIFSIDGFTNSTVVHVTATKSITNSSFVVAPGSAGYQELDTNVVATLFRMGNWNYKDHGVPATESLGASVLPNSLLYTSKPNWWPTGKPWPAIGPDLNPLVVNLPAQDRYLGIGTTPVSGVGSPGNLRIIGQ